MPQWPLIGLLLGSGCTILFPFSDRADSGTTTGPDAAARSDAATELDAAARSDAATELDAAVPPFCTTDEQCPRPSVLQDERCLVSRCVAGYCAVEPLDCSDGVDCTDDVCRLGACLHSPNAGRCVDAEATYCHWEQGCITAPDCRQSACPLASNSCMADTCQQSLCRQGVDECAGGGFPTCAVSFCDVGADRCLAVLDHTRCTDADPCTVDLCDPGSERADDFGCVIVDRVTSCDDGDEGTVDICQPGLGCQHRPIE